MHKSEQHFADLPFSIKQLVNQFIKQHSVRARGVKQKYSKTLKRTPIKGR